MSEEHCCANRTFVQRRKRELRPKQKLCTEACSLHAGRKPASLVVNLTPLVTGTGQTHFIKLVNVNSNSYLSTIFTIHSEGSRARDVWLLGRKSVVKSRLRASEVAPRGSSSLTPSSRKQLCLHSWPRTPLTNLAPRDTNSTVRRTLCSSSSSSSLLLTSSQWPAPGASSVGTHPVVEARAPTPLAGLQPLRAPLLSSAAAEPPSSAVEEKMQAVESVLGRLVEELQNVKRDNELLRNELRAIHAQPATEAHHAVNIANSASPASTALPSPSVWLPPSSPTFEHRAADNGDPNTPEAQLLIQRLMPFLSKYNVKPVVLDDLKYLPSPSPFLWSSAQPTRRLT